MSDPHSDVDAIARIDAVPTILEVVCRTTGMGFAAVARVTEDRWIACAVRDEIQLRAEARRRAQGRDHDLPRDPGERASRRHRPRRRGRGLLRPPDAGDVRLPELHLDADPPPERRVLRHALRDRSAAGEAEHARDDRHVQALRRPDRLPPRRAGAARDERGGAPRRAPGRRAARAVHRRARPRPAQSARLDRRRRAGCCARRRSTRRRRRPLALIAEQRPAHGRAHRQRARLRARAARRRPRARTAAERRRSRRSLEQVVAELRAAWPDRAIEAEIALAGPSIATAPRIGQLLSNLLANALTHGAPDRPGLRSARAATGGGFELSVANAGEPIPPATHRAPVPAVLPRLGPLDPAGPRPRPLHRRRDRPRPRRHADGQLKPEETRFTLRMPARAAQRGRTELAAAVG